MKTSRRLGQLLADAAGEDRAGWKTICFVLSWAVSLVFHPLLMPTILNLIVFRYCTDLLPLTYEAKVQTLGFVFISTYLIPGLATSLLWATGAIGSITLEKRSDRTIPLLVTAIVYLAVSYIFLDFLSMVRLLGLFMGAITMAVLATALITRFWKISAHMTGMGGLMGFLLAVVMKTGNHSLEVPFIAGLAASGGVASARLFLGAHTIWQIAAGFFMGMVISCSAVCFFV